MKLYLRVDDDVEDDLIQQMIDTASEYIKEATGFKFEKEIPERAKMIVKLLVSHWYDNRTIAVSGKNVTNLNFTVEALLNQLKYTYEGDSK